MTRTVDTDTPEEQRFVYHLVCHDCPTESVVTVKQEAQEKFEEHRAATGHNVELAPIAAVEPE